MPALRHSLPLLLLLALAPGPPVFAQQGGGNAYAVDAIDVDVAAPTIESARTAAFRIAQRKGWAQLWSRLTGGTASAAPKLTDGQLDSIVSGIESQGEQFSTTRYIARLGVIFDRSRARAYLGDSGVTLQSPPMLLMPVLSDGGVRILYQQKSLWVTAWQRYRENVTPIDYIVASGSAGDNLLLTNWQVRRPDRASWRNILNRFDATDVLIAEARLVRAWPGGPVTGLFIARHGPDAGELSRFNLRAADEAGIPAMLDTAVRQIDEIYAVALRNGTLKGEPDLAAEMAPIIAAAPLIGTSVANLDEAGEPQSIASFEALLPTPDAATATALETLVRGTPGVTAVTITSLSLGGTSRLIINHVGARDVLVYALDQRGLRLTNEGADIVLRRRRDGDVPLQRPASLDPEVAAVPLPTVPATTAAAARPAVAPVPPGTAKPGVPPASVQALPTSNATPTRVPTAAPATRPAPATSRGAPPPSTTPAVRPPTTPVLRPSSTPVARPSSTPVARPSSTPVVRPAAGQPNP